MALETLFVSYNVAFGFVCFCRTHVLRVGQEPRNLKQQFCFFEVDLGDVSDGYNLMT